MDKKLFCFDFDQTITNGHMHSFFMHNQSILSTMSLEDGVSIFLEGSEGIKNKAALEATFKQI